VTTEANGPLRAIHDRMPLCLDATTLELWLARDTPSPKALGELVTHARAADLVAHAVDPRMNAATVDDPSCIEPWAPPDSSTPDDGGGQLGLFD